MYVSFPFPFREDSAPFQALGSFLQARGLGPPIIPSLSESAHSFSGNELQNIPRSTSQVRTAVFPVNETSQCPELKPVKNRLIAFLEACC